MTNFPAITMATIGLLSRGDCQGATDLTPKIQDLAPDQKITEPGFYRMPLERHHSQPCDGVSVTSSVLRKMELETPADVWAFSLLNPDRYEEADKPAFRLGRAMASYIEGAEEGVARDFIILPPSPPKRPTDAQRNAKKPSPQSLDAIKFWDGIEKNQRETGRAVLTWSEWENIEQMGKVLLREPAAVAALDGLPEITMAWRDEETGLWLLARPDNLKFDGMLSDYKKFSAQGRPITGALIDRKIEQFGYHMQMAFASEVFWRLTGHWPPQVGLVFQSDKPPHHVILRGIDGEAITWGRMQNRRAIRRFAECLASGHWPGPGEVIGNYRMSDWLEERLREQHGQGLLPEVDAQKEEAA